MFKSWSIRNKLLLGLTLLLVIVGTLSWGGIHGLYAYRDLVRSLGRRVDELPLAGRFGRCVSDLRVALADARTLHQPAALDQPRSEFAVPLAREEFRLNLVEAEQIVEKYRRELTDNDEYESAIGDDVRERQTLADIDAVLARIRQLNEGDDWLLDEVRTSQLDGELRQLERLTAALPSYLHENIASFAEHARGQYRLLIVLSWVTSVSTVAIMVFLVNLFYRGIFRPLRVLVRGSRKVASGCFEHRIELDSHDEMAELAGAMNGMTERFRTIRDDLDRQVAERTREAVRNEQLASVGFLAAGVAHEINNPLASIAFCAESLDQRLDALSTAAEPEREQVREYLQLIQSEAFRCKQITEKLLDFSRTGDVRRQAADLRELVAAMIDVLSHLGRYRGQQISLEPGEPVLIDCNPQEIKQVALNLLTNALDSLEGEGRVTVRVERREGAAELTVSDTGCGMTPEVLQHLFEPFFTRRHNGQGTGLGLSITSRIVADHQGSIRAHSDGPGAGSQFRVRLPLAEPVKESHHRYHQAA